MDPRTVMVLSVLGLLLGLARMGLAMTSIRNERLGVALMAVSGTLTVVVIIWWVGGPAAAEWAAGWIPLIAIITLAILAGPHIRCWSRRRQARKRAELVKRLGKGPVTVEIVKDGVAFIDAPQGGRRETRKPARGEIVVISDPSVWGTLLKTGQAKLPRS